MAASARARFARKKVHSAGLVCFDEALEQVLIVRRRHSLSFSEFLRGKYSARRPEYIARLLARMTRPEQEACARGFEAVHEEAWGEPPADTRENARLREQQEAVASFVSETVTLLGAQARALPEPEWGFPKGRANFGEGEEACAVRECCEETGARPDQLRVLAPAIVVAHTGTNGVPYSCSLFPAVCTLRDPRVDPAVPHQAREVSLVAWVPAREAAALVSATYPSFRAVIPAARELAAKSLAV